MTLSKLISDLKEEHRTIERLLASLIRVAAHANVGDQVTKPLLTNHVTLFRVLADSFHHGREEEILFKAMHESGMPYERGPLSVMLREHDEGRKCVSALSEIATAPGPLSASNLEGIRYYAAAFAELLSSHIAKEDNVLYPMAEARLGFEGLAKLDVVAGTSPNQDGLDRLHLIKAAEHLSESTLVTSNTPSEFSKAV
jgi:hemerythrin-like domain-containing protein